MKRSDREQQEFQKLRKIPRDPVQKERTWRQIQERIETEGVHSQAKQTFSRALILKWTALPALAIGLFLFVIMGWSDSTEDGIPLETANAPLTEREFDDGRDTPDLPAAKFDDPSPADPGGRSSADAPMPDVDPAVFQTWTEQDNVEPVLFLNNPMIFLDALDEMSEEDRRMIVGHIQERLQASDQLGLATDLLESVDHPLSDDVLKWLKD